MAYDIEKIKAKLAAANEPKKSNNDKTKTKYFKAAIGSYDIRFLPYEDKDSQPFETVGYYNKLTKFGEPRIIAPGTYDLPDPIKPIFESLRKGKENWSVAKNLQPQDRCYAVIIDRAHEDEGPLVWEMSPGLRDKIYGILTNKFNIKKQMFDPKAGFDFTLEITQEKDTAGKPKFFNGKPCKAFELQAYPESSPLHTDTKTAKAWLEAMPKLAEMFKSQVLTPEQLEEKCQNFIASLQASPPSAEGAEHGVTKEQSDKAGKDAIDEAFDDIPL